MRIRATVTHQASFVGCQSSPLQHLATHVVRLRSAFSGSSKIFISSIALSRLHAPVPDSGAVCWWPARRLLCRDGVCNFGTKH